MNKGFLFHSIILIAIAIVILSLEDYPNIYASKTHNNKYNSTDSTFFLPFNSHIADQSIHEKKYSSNIIPFPWLKINFNKVYCYLMSDMFDKEIIHVHFYLDVTSFSYSFHFRILFFKCRIQFLNKKIIVLMPHYILSIILRDIIAKAKSCFNTLFYCICTMYVV
jgi:hypothetical protein